jgi:Family of unknown function (DUF5995)
MADERGREGAGSVPGTVAQVLERLAAIERELPETDGVARFNDLYLAMTREIEAELGKRGFEDPRFLTRLDVVFADRYLAAVDAGSTHEARSPAWAPLFEARKRRGIAPIQFALAGCNAHINYDLAVALVETCRELTIALEPDSPQHRDFLQVNGILAEVEERVKKRFDEGLVGVADEALGRLDDVVAMWSMERARDAAWTHAEVLWKLREVSALEEQYVATLAHIVGLAGRGLLVPVL